MYKTIAIYHPTHIHISTNWRLQGQRTCGINTTSWVDILLRSIDVITQHKANTLS